MRRLRRIRARHARRVFRALIAVTVVFCLAGVGTFAWLGVEQAGAARRAAESSALAAKDDHSAEKYARMVAKAREYNRRLAATPHVIGETSGKDGTIDGDFGFKSDTEYQNLLDFGDGIMATIEIPSIGVDLPVRQAANPKHDDNAGQTSLNAAQQATVEAAAKADKVMASTGADTNGIILAVVAFAGMGAATLDLKRRRMDVTARHGMR